MLTNFELELKNVYERPIFNSVSHLLITALTYFSNDTSVRCLTSKIYILLRYDMIIYVCMIRNMNKL